MNVDTEGIATMLSLDRRYVTNTMTKHPNFPRPTVNLSQKLRRWDDEAVRAFAANPSRKPS